MFTILIQRTEEVSGVFTNAVLQLPYVIAGTEAVFCSPTPTLQMICLRLQMGLPFGGAFLFAAVPVLCWFGLRRVIIRSQIFEKFRAGTSLRLLLLTNALRFIAP